MLIPSTVPSAAVRGPPELPPLREASVWISFRPVPLSVSSRLMLPVVTVAGEDALLPAVRPDYIETEYQGRRVRCGEYLVAVSGGGLHADYHMVAGPELLENEEAAV